MDELKQIQPMKGRPATKIEAEAMGAICKLQDELHDARSIIRQLLDIEPCDPMGAIIARNEAIEFLKVVNRANLANDKDRRKR